MMKYEVFAALRKLGATKAVAHFSGGNDEGGVDSIDFFDSTGNRLDIPADPYHVSRAWGDSVDVDGNVLPSDSMVVTIEPVVKVAHPAWKGRETYACRLATPDEIALHNLLDALGAPVHAQYGGFGGEFHVSGRVVWENGTATMEGVEQSGYESFSRTW